MGAQVGGGCQMGTALWLSRWMVGGRAVLPAGTYSGSRLMAPASASPVPHGSRKGAQVGTFRRLDHKLVK